MKRFQITVSDDSNDELFRTEWLLTNAQAQIVVRSLANAYSPRAVSVTICTSRRSGDSFETLDAADFIVSTL